MRKRIQQNEARNDDELRRLRKEAAELED